MRRRVTEGISDELNEVEYFVVVRSADAGAGAPYLSLMDARVPDEVRTYFQSSPNDYNPDKTDIDDETWEKIASRRDDRFHWRRWGKRYPQGGFDRYGTMNLPVLVGHQSGRAWHCGDDWSDLDADPSQAAGFTIQTIVEGSDETVDSDRFEFPVFDNEIDSWMKGMEAEASWLWKRDNGDWYQIYNAAGDEIGIVVNIWGDIEWVGDNLPDPMKVAINDLFNREAHLDPESHMPLDQAGFDADGMPYVLELLYPE
jgi:hypothetical protein